MGKSLLRVMVLCTPFMLVSCGEGWEAQRVDNIAPYGGSRTAGTGVAYVRAKMMPEKELKIEPMVEVMSEPVVEATPVLDAEEIFNEAQTKGSAPVKKSTPVMSEPEKQSLNGHRTDEVLGEVSKIEASASNKTESARSIELTAEEYIQQAPKKLEMVHVEPLAEDAAKEKLVAELDAVQEETEKLSAERVVDKVVEKKALDAAKVTPAAHTKAGLENVVEVHENKVVTPATEIVSPKKDVFKFKSRGQYDLEDIYDDPFADD
ncbi:MAG: hypothetical protein COA45_01315 [Zetaproteobacteria bacterium]|nr:MAG: hypothetical protein COA45_01315 [Zetaproteobacteria bacterium]